MCIYDLTVCHGCAEVWKKIKSVSVNYVFSLLYVGVSLCVGLSMHMQNNVPHIQRAKCRVSEIPNTTGFDKTGFDCRGSLPNCIVLYTK